MCNQISFCKQANGDVVLTDLRIRGGRQRTVRCYDGYIPTLSHHPSNEHLILASCHSGFAIFLSTSQLSNLIAIFQKIHLASRESLTFGDWNRLQSLLVSSPSFLSRSR